MPFPIPSPRITPGPNAFAQQRQSLQGNSHINPQYLQDLANARPTQTAGSNGNYVYSPSVYTPAERYTSDSPRSREDLVRSRDYQAKPSGQTRPSAGSDKNKELPPNPASRFVEYFRDTPSPTQEQRQHDPNWLQPIPESNTTWRAPTIHQRARPPPRLDMKLAKVEEANTTSRLRAVSSESNVDGRSQQADTTPKRRFLERIRAFPVKPNYPPNYQSEERSVSREFLVGGQRQASAEKAARLLGTTAKDLPNAQHQLETNRALVTLPSFGDLNLPEPTPPFATDGLSYQKTREGHTISPGQSRYSPRMMRDASDHRLLLLNDRIASNTSENSYLSPVPSSDPIPSSEVEHQQSHSPNNARLPEPPKSPLRRINTRIGNEKSTRPIFGSQAPEESVHNFVPEREMDVRLRSGVARNRPMFGSDDMQNTLSICGSLHDSTSNETGLSSSYREKDVEDAETASQRSSPEINWPIVFQEHGVSLPLTTPSDSQSTFRPTSVDFAPPTAFWNDDGYRKLVPSPLRVQHPAFRPQPPTATSHDTSAIPGNGKSTFTFRQDTNQNEVHKSPLELGHSQDIENTPKSRAVKGTEQPDSPTPDKTPKQRTRALPVHSPPNRAAETSETPITQPTMTPRSARLASNQPWRSLSNTPTVTPEGLALKDIASVLDYQRREIFELKGDVNRNDKGNASRCDALETNIEGVQKVVNEIKHELVSLRDVLVTTRAYGYHSPPVTGSSNSSHGIDVKTSPRRNNTSQPPTSFPANLSAVPDDSSVSGRIIAPLPRRVESKHRRERSGSGSVVVGPPNHQSPRRNHSQRHRRGRSNTTNSIELTPTKAPSSGNSTVAFATPIVQPTRTPSNSSSVRSAIHHIERKASDGTVRRVATAEEVFSRPPRPMGPGTAPRSRHQSPSKQTIAQRGIAAMKRALSPTRAPNSRPHTPNASVSSVRSEQLARSAPPRDAQGLGIEDLADFGVSPTPTPTLYGRREYASERANGRDYNVGYEGEPRGWRSTR